MTAPMLDVRVDWRGDGFSYVTNDSFLTDTTGWSVSAGINAAGTSITRGTGDGVLGDATTNTYAALVTTATSGSGVNFDFGTTTFTAGRTYRLAAWLKRTSGSTSARLRIGSLGTASDRGDATVTVTDSWARYSVDWTPSGTRTDVEAAITNGSASALTVRLCLVEAFEAFDDIGPYGRNDVTAATWGRGANFDGSAESPGTAAIRVANPSPGNAGTTGPYSPRNATGDLYGLILPGRRVWIRAVYDGLVYGCFYGFIRRIVQDVEGQAAEFACEDILSYLGSYRVNVDNSLSRSIRDYRDAILTAAGLGTGLGPARTSLAYGIETAIPFTGAWDTAALELLAELNISTGSVHHIDPHPSPSVCYAYSTIDRVTLASGAAVETYEASVTEGIVFEGDDLSDELWVNAQLVYPTLSRLDPEAVLLGEFADVPYTLAAADALVVNLDRPPVGTVTYAVTSDAAVTAGDVGFYGTTWYQEVTAFAYPVTISAIAITGKGVAQSTGVRQTSTTGDGDHWGEPITGQYINSYAHAKGLATWTTYRYGSPKTRAVLTVANRPTAHLSRDIGDRIAVTLSDLSISAVEFLVRGVSTAVTGNGLAWITSLDIEEAPTAGNWFTVGGTADQGIGGTAILAY